MKHIKLFEQFLQESLIFNTPEISYEQAIEEINQALEGVVPVKNVTKGTFGKDSVYILIVFDPREEWPNKIMENANYFRMVLSQDGSMEVFAQSLYYKDMPVSYDSRVKIKFRKTKAKNTQDAIQKLIKYIETIQQELSKK
jgi:hypothetical protein